MGVIVPFTLPHRDAALMLDSVLREKYRDRFAGFTARKDHIEVFIADDVTDAERIEIAQIVTCHDYTLRTPEQLARIARDARLAALRVEMQAHQDALKGTPFMEWVTLELAVVKERLGIVDS